MKLVAAALAATLLLLAPALWNGFPLLEYDTGGYLARWFEGTLEVSRSTVYGLFLVALARPDFWPAVVAQAALTVWVIALLLRAHGLGGRPVVLLVTVALLSAATTLPWIAGILLTDIFAGLGVLALYLLVLRAETLTRWERVALVVLVAFAAASHSATLAVLLALLALAFTVALFSRKLIARAALGRGVAALALGPVMLVAAKGESVFDRLGRFQGLNDEMRTIVLESLRDYPLWQLQAAANAAVRQLVAVKTGEGVLNSIWHTYDMMENFTPSTLPAMRAARQQQGELDFRAVNTVHVPVALASMVLLLATIVLARNRERFADLGPLAATAALAILANAAVCGVLANPHDRYGARLAWIATFVVALVLWRALSGGRETR